MLSRWRYGRFVAAGVVLQTVCALSAAEPQADVEVWNEGVEYYRAGDVTNALRVLKPLMLSKSHGARAAEVVAAISHDRGDREGAAVAAQIALRANPDDQRVNRNFTRATDGLLAERETRRIEAVLKASQGKDPGAMLLESTREARRLLSDAGSYRTNSAVRAVAIADSLAVRAGRIVDSWIPVREAIAQNVTNEEQAATILAQIESAQAKTKRAARELGDLADGSYATVSDVEHDFTRFLKLVIMPPAAIAEDELAQTNALTRTEIVNGRDWQPEALDYTRAFRAKFPAWARSYEQQAQSDTNRPPFTAEDQAKVSALATELEKVQLECCEKPADDLAAKALSLIREIRELMPKDKNGGGQGQQNQDKSQNQEQQNQDQQNQDQQNQDQDQNQQDQKQGDQPEESESGEQQEPPTQPEDEKPEDKEVEALLKKAEERNDEHEADKKARMRKAPLPPNERDW